METVAGIAASGQSTSHDVGVPACGGQRRNLPIVADYELEISGGRTEPLLRPSLQFAGRDPVPLLGQGSGQPDRLLGIALHTGDPIEGV